MGAPSIADMEGRENEYRQYLDKLQTELQTKASSQTAAMNSSIDAFYAQSGWKHTEYILGTNYDFMQEQSWSLQNLADVIGQIGKAMFGDGGKMPSGVTVKSSEDVSKALAEVADLELYMVGQAFDLLSGILASFGASTSVTFKATTENKPLGNGFRLFTSVAQDSYKSTDFFNGAEILEYLYDYQIQFSENEAEQQADILLTKLYEDQIAAFVQQQEALLSQLEDNSLTPQQYESSNEIYDKLSAAAKEKLKSLEGSTVTARL